MTFICKNKKFIFIHLYKNAGSSIKTSLRKRVKNDLDLIPSVGIYKFDSLMFKVIKKSIDMNFLSLNNKIQYAYYKNSSHLEYKTLEKYIKNIDEFKTFAIVRNPFSWQVSQYKFMRSNPKHPNHKFIKGLNFNEYLKWRCSKKKATQTSYLSSIENNFKISKMIKIENLKKEWANLLKWIDIPYVELPYKNVTQTDDQEYKKFYNNDSLELLIKNFSEDFKNFNYSYSLWDNPSN